MGRSISVEGIALYARIAPCAHNCRYCLLGDKKLAHISFSRFASIVERFIDWKEERGMTDFKIFHWIRHSFDCDMDTMNRWIKLWARLGRSPDVLLGGLPVRSEKEMRGWLQERKDAGIKEVHASFAGHGKVHDRWNGRRGDFEFQMSTLKIAAELGLEISQRLLLTRSTLPLLDELIDRLDSLPGHPKKRYLCPLFYMGSATRLENERVTREMLESLPRRIMSLYGSDIRKWRSEPEWMRCVREEDEGPQKVMLRLEPDENNIDTIERMSCDEILADLKTRTRQAYNAIPGRRELCEMAGDPTNTRIYVIRNDIERKWLDHYLESDPTPFDRILTHLSMVQ